MKYTKRADGRYATSVIIGYRDDGKPLRKLLYGKTIRELEGKLNDFRQAREKGIVYEQNITFGEWADKWLTLYKKNKEYNTYEMYKNAVKRLEPLRGVRLKTLKKHQIQEVLNGITERGASRTAEITLMTVKQIINSAIDEQYIFIDVTRGLTIPKHTAKEKRALTDEEIQRIKDAQLTAKERAFIEILLYCGLRRGEALALTTDDIKDGTVRVCKNLIFKSDGTSEIKNSPKSDKSTRRVPIPDALAESLGAQIAQADENDGILFPMSTRNDYMTQSAFRHFWKNISEKAELADDVTPHILRHTYATRLFFGGVDVKTAQSLLGHATVQITLDVYTHLQNDTDDARAKINAAFGARNTAKNDHPA